MIPPFLSGLRGKLTSIDPFHGLKAIENLALALCKSQKWKEQVKVSKCQKFGDLILKTVTLIRFLKTEISIENVSDCCADRAYDTLPASNTYKLPYFIF